MGSEFISSVISEKILTIQFNRPDKKNALTSAMYAEMTALFLNAENSPEISTVLIQGQSDLFTSGNDVKDFLHRNPDEVPQAVHFLNAISNFSKPIVAIVGGDAIGIGTTMLMHCDLVIAGENARFQLPFVNLGLCPEAASSYLLQELAGTKMANQLLLLGETFDSEVALKAGLINYISPEETLLESGLNIAQNLSRKPADALRTTKRLMKMHHTKIVNQTIKDELVEFSRLLNTPASKEIFSAFLGKRKPDKNIIESN